MCRMANKVFPIHITLYYGSLVLNMEFRVLHTEFGVYEVCGFDSGDIFTLTVSVCMKYFFTIQHKDLFTFLNL